MRAIGFLLVAALLPAAAPPPPPDARADARDVMRVVVPATTRSYGAPARAPFPCVQARLDPASIVGGGFGDARIDLLFGWHASGEGRGAMPIDRVLPAGDREAIREALRAARYASTQRRWLTRIEPGWVAPALGFCAGAEYRRLVFGSPVIVGDVAFVGVYFLCPTCGEGGSVALRRTSRGWKIVAARVAWMS